MSSFGFSKYNDYEVVIAAEIIKKYIYDNYCSQCIEDSGIREESFNYDECHEQRCPIILTKEVLYDIIKENENRNMKGNNDMSDNIFFEITENIGTISEYATGWNKELNLVKWNGANEAKFDIRDWEPNHERMSRGITLHEEEVLRLRDLLNQYFDEE